MLVENSNQCSLKIKANEKYTTDKFMESIKYMHGVETKINNLATIAITDELKIADKDLKQSFNAEFELFQQYLKEQNEHFHLLQTKIREMERKFGEF